jgi:quercetin dioxygenase-like cupin family protein
MDIANLHRIPFDGMDWTQDGTGVRSKVFQHGSQRIRLVEFSESFIEPGWCVKGHAFYVLDGSFSIDFAGNVERYNAGDISFIPAGEADKHRAVLGKDERVLLLMYEEI